jgi:hypothetical protein
VTSADSAAPPAEPDRGISAHEATKTYLCKSPGCENEAKTWSGRHAYCKTCQIRRGTAQSDGSAIQGRIPSAPGSRSGRNFPVEGHFEAKVMRLVGSARELDFWLERYGEARPALEQAIKGWHEALQAFSKALPPKLSVALELPPLPPDDPGPGSRPRRATSASGSSSGPDETREVVQHRLVT